MSRAVLGRPRRRDRQRTGDGPAAGLEVPGASCAASCSTRCRPDGQVGAPGGRGRALGDEQARGDVRRRDDRDDRPAGRRETGRGRGFRPLLSAAQPEYVGTSYVETYLYEADARRPAGAQAVGGGALLALAPGRGIPGPPGARRRPAHLRGADQAERVVRRHRLRRRGGGGGPVAGEFDGWAPELTALITEGETPPVLRALHTLPADHRWTGCPE